MINDLRNIFSNKEIDFVFHLEKAIEKNEFELYFQPIIHSISGSLCGFEALVRWHHPTLGFLTPPQFLIPLEETRQIYHLDIHVIEKVCQWYEEQVNAGRPVVPVSVNLSRVDFESTDMFRVIEALTEKYHMPHNMLNIEITESAISDNADLMHTTIDRFREAGHQVWMDDFGSGYSSLDVLQDIHFDLIKLDMRFMQRFGESEDSKIIVAELIRMAIELGVDTICEGVENGEEVGFLRKNGCTKLQGFFYGKPAPWEGLSKEDDKQQ